MKKEIISNTFTSQNSYLTEVMINLTNHKSNKYKLQVDFCIDEKTLMNKQRDYIFWFTDYPSVKKTMNGKYFYDLKFFKGVSAIIESLTKELEEKYQM